MSKWELLVGVSGAAAKNSPVYILVYREDILGLNDKFVNIARILHRLLVVLLRLVVVQQHRHQEGGEEEEAVVVLVVVVVVMLGHHYLLLNLRMVLDPSFHRALTCYVHELMPTMLLISNLRVR